MNLFNDLTVLCERTIEKKSQELAEAQIVKQQLLQQQYNASAQLKLQEALYKSLCSTIISTKLCRLTDCDNLIPSGFTNAGATTVYHFAWAKTNSDEMIAVTLLSRYVQKMNTVIRVAQHKFYEYLLYWDDYTKQQLICLNALLYNGFTVIECADFGDAIIISVRID